MPTQLVVISGPDMGRTFPLADGQTLAIGRGSQSPTALTDPRVSRQQCVVEVVGQRFVLSDSHSSGGTYVKGERITRVDLLPGDVFSIGQTLLRLEA